MNIGQGEDDTFKALRRTPILKLRRIVDAWIVSSSDYRTIEVILEENRWTREDWDTENNTRMKNAE